MNEELKLKEGEKYAFGVTLPNGQTIHTILLPGDESVPNWDAGIAWAKDKGGDLPDRAEQALFYKHMPEEFRKNWYWSNTQHASYSDYAWFQSFLNGYQDISHEDITRRARAVRRLVI